MKSLLSSQTLIMVIFLATLGITSVDTTSAAPTPPSPEPRPDKCLTKDEAELAAKINKLRADNKLPQLPVSRSLYSVAKWHVIDLSLFAPHENAGKQCDLHSWSDKGIGRGGWKPLCYTADHANALDMFKKPYEIANYMANGYENIYWTSAPLTPAMVMNGWENRKDEKDIILQQSNFNRNRWTSMGVGIYGNYASVWFGEGVPSEDVMAACVIK